MRERRARFAPAALCLFALSFGLAGCEDGKSLADSDWIHSPSEVPNPSPDPSSSPTPEPTPTPTPTPTPSPTPTPTPTSGQVFIGSSELAKYVNKFVDDAKMQGVNVLPSMKNPTLEVRVASLASYGSSVIGLCETGGGRRRVTLDPNFWNSVSETQREILMHHELGHCVLYRGHRNTILSSGLYASVMYPIIMKSSSYLNNYDYYQEELFSYAASLALSSALVSSPEQEIVHVCDHHAE